jgi:hypothetical protein
VTDDGAEWLAELDALNHRLGEHPGWIAQQRWEALRRTVDIHWRNLAELEHLIRAPTKDLELALELMQNERPPVVRERYWAALDQRLHNALASAFTLVDHARRLVRHYPRTAFAAEFEERKAAIKNDNRAAFIGRLRNYRVHYSEPPLAHQVTFGADIVVTVQLQANVLRKWGRENWEAPAWEYLQQVGDYVDLGALVAWYRTATLELYQWLFAQFDEMHGDDVDLANELIRQYNRLLSGEDDDGSVETQK